MNNSIINTAQINRARINIAGLNCVGIPSSRSDKPTLDPALKAKLVGVWNCRGKTNEDADRGIIRDRTGNGNHLEILNAAYKLNSGYGLWKENFNDGIWSKLLGVNKAGTRITLNSEKDWSKGGWITYKTSGNVIASFKVKISGMPVGGDLRFSSVKMVDGINVIPSYTATAAIGFSINSIGQDWSKLVIEQIPDYQGAFVTDGIVDVIVSKKTVSEMIGDAKEITVFSIIHQITGRYNSSSPALTNYIVDGLKFIRNSTSTLGKTGIYGYTIDVSSGAKSVISNILGDKNDYTIETNLASLSAVFSVCGRITGAELNQLAYYGGGIAIGKLTTDEINQVIAGFNLDSFIEPDGWYDVAKQGITNENHATFNDKLIDFSPNKRDLVCNNFSWGGNSGVGKWGVDFKSDFIINIDTTRTGQVVTFNRSVTSSNVFLLYNKQNLKDINPFIVNVDFDTSLRYFFFTETGRRSSISLKRGINILPKSYNSKNAIVDNAGFHVQIEDNYARIEQIPEQEGGLWHDGVDDSCQYVGNLGLKDYTVIWDREYGVQTGNAIALVSGVLNSTNVPFILDMIRVSNNIVLTASFDGNTSVGNIEQNKTRKISYQSTYVRDSRSIVKGSSIKTGDGLTIGKYGNEQYTNLGFYGLLLYPYSMNAFLIERQLKKLKFGTLYPKNE